MAGFASRAGVAFMAEHNSMPLPKEEDWLSFVDVAFAAFILGFALALALFGFFAVSTLFCFFASFVLFFLSFMSFLNGLQSSVVFPNGFKTGR